jgi:hypothetical protein
MAYVVFRLSLGIKLLIHGAGRFLGPGVEAFSSKTMIEFAGTPLPAGFGARFPDGPAVRGIPSGGLITLDLFTRWALTLGAVLITALILFNCAAE